jgi:hypothetical protein
MRSIGTEEPTATGFMLVHLLWLLDLVNRTYLIIQDFSI